MGGGNRSLIENVEAAHRDVNVVVMAWTSLAEAGKLWISWKLPDFWQSVPNSGAANSDESEVPKLPIKPKYTANVASLSLSLSPSLNDEDWREILNEVKSHEPKN